MSVFTKTDYKNYLECGCYLWMAKRKKELLPPSASELFREKEGEKVDALANLKSKLVIKKKVVRLEGAGLKSAQTL